MNKILEFFIRGIISLIWLVATIVTSLILSPFLLVGWLSRIITKEEKDKSGDD